MTKKINKSRKCKDSKTGFLYKKHNLVEHGFYVYYKRCGKIIKVLKWRMKVSKSVKPKIVSKAQIEDPIKKRLCFLYKSKQEINEALARKLRIFNKKQTEELGAEIRILSEMSTT